MDITNTLYFKIVTDEIAPLISPLLVNLINSLDAHIESFNGLQKWSLKNLDNNGVFKPNAIMDEFDIKITETIDCELIVTQSINALMLEIAKAKLALLK